MLLRQAEPADVDGYISAAAAMNSTGEEQQPQDTTAPRTDPLDDVFGSDGDDNDSPVFEDDVYESNQQHIRIIGRDPSATAHQQHNHPSDIHRLRQEHTTSGYREGITAAKASSVQAGFDEGFGLGATIGLRVGYLLGVLEGVAAALGKEDPNSSVTAEDRAEASKLLADARAELVVQAVFGPEYWDSDGTWRYEVGTGHDGEEEEEVVFSHVAEAHPLVRKWTAAVGEVMRRWGLEEQLPLLQRRDDEDAGAAGEQQPVAARVKAVAPPQPDAKVANDALSW